MTSLVFGTQSDSTPPESLFDLKNVGRREGSAWLLRGITLKLRPGEFMAVLGPNGAGKSTLLRILDATLRPSEGTLSLLGNPDPWHDSESQRVRLRSRIGVVPQRTDFNPLIPLSAREIVAIGRLRGRAFSSRLTPSDEEIIEDSMERMGITALARRTYRSLSGGEQQKVQMARALTQQPQLLLLDEPASGLDFLWQERLVEIIATLSESVALPIVMTTHVLSHLPSCCNRVALMSAGRILFDGTAAEALSPGRLGELYGAPVEIIERDGRRHCLGCAVPSRGAGPVGEERS